MNWDDLTKEETPFTLSPTGGENRQAGGTTHQKNEQSDKQAELIEKQEGDRTAKRAY